MNARVCVRAQFGSAWIRLTAELFFSVEPSNRAIDDGH